jgi:hypothetical protein
MRNHRVAPWPAVRTSIAGHRLRVSGLGLIAVAAALVAAVVAAAVNSGPNRPFGGAVTAPRAVAPILAPDDDQPIKNTAGVAATTRLPSAAPSSPGYVLMNSRLIGETPGGLDVWVSPTAQHHGTIAQRATRAISDLSRLGVPIRWRGYGTPRAAEGVVQINENQSGCQGGPNVVGMTWPYWMSLPNGSLYTYRANVALCPQLFTKYASWQWDATVRHELGHAVGLGHTNYVYGGSYQDMNAVTHYGVTTYRAGDVNGLRHLAAGTARVRSAMAPAGTFDRSSWTAGNRLTFTGWSLLTYYKTRGVTITLTDNGRVAARAATTVVRADVNKRYDPGHRAHGFSVSIPWRGGNHSYCITSTSSVSRTSVARLGCVSWHS